MMDNMVNNMTQNIPLKFDPTCRFGAFHWSFRIIYTRE